MRKTILILPKWLIIVQRHFIKMSYLLRETPKGSLHFEDLCSGLRKIRDLFYITLQWIIVHQGIINHHSLNTDMKASPSRGQEQNQDLTTVLLSPNLGFPLHHFRPNPHFVKTGLVKSSVIQYSSVCWEESNKQLQSIFLAWPGFQSCFLMVMRGSALAQRACDRGPLVMEHRLLENSDGS